MSNKESGQLLLEILVAISVLAVIVAAGSQLIYVGMVGNKSASEKNVAQGLSVESIEAVQNAAFEKWQDIYNLTKGSTDYYPQQSNGKWAIAAGSESVVINDIAYTRSFTIQNVCRDNTTRNITDITDSNGSSTTACTLAGGSPDPSTQKINVSISWPDAEPFTHSEYVTRWRNKVCLQTNWGGGAGSGTTTCPASVYGSKSNITAGTDLQLCSGGC